MTSSPWLWEAVRASGIVAYVLVTVTVLAGVLLAGKVRLVRWPRFAVEDVHRFLGALLWVFIALHVLTTAADSYVGFSTTDLVVPFAGGYKPLGMGLGIAATELLLALALANRLRSRLSYRFWRRTHYLNFAVWASATFHGLLAGTDRLPLLYALTVGVVVTATAVRAGAGGARRGPEPEAAGRALR